MIAGKIYKGTKEDLREIMLKFASEVLKEVMGIPNFFQSKIAFVSNASSKKEIYLADFDGGNITKLSDAPNYVLSPAFSKDGNWLAYTSYQATYPDLIIKNLKDNISTLISFNCLNVTPEWLPSDNKYLAVTLSRTGDQEIYLIDRDGNIKKRLTNKQGIDVSPSFSPDGSKMAFVSDRGGTPQIYIMDLESKKTKRLTFKGKYNTSPAWSPNGQKILYVGLSKENKLNIFSIEPSGQNNIQLTFSKNSNNESPSWSPDGNFIIFSSDRTGFSKIYVMNSNGEDLKLLIKHKGQQFQPFWGKGISL